MRFRITVLFMVICLSLSVVAVHEPAAANLLLTNGVVRSGTVAVRISAWSKEPIITLRSLNNRLYQFSAQQVAEVTAETEVIIRDQTELHTEPSSESATVTRLEKGNEVTIIAHTGDWVRVRAWGDHEGWVEERRLCDRVVFSKRNR